jgi:hypothetical protein
MAAGWPTKVSYVNGDVYSAQDVNDSNGTINLLTSTTLSRAAGKNAVINGGMDIWQRGTSFSLAASTVYTSGFSADRWQTQTNTNQACTLSRQATGDTTNLPNIQYALRFQRNSGQTGVGALSLVQNFESVNSIPFAGKSITFSFYARAGANFSGSLTPFLVYGTGTDQNAFSTYTGQTTVATGTATLTTTWQRFTYTGTVAATATELAIVMNWVPSGTAGTNDYYEITGFQVELGLTATTFSRAGGTIQGELANCQRYFFQYVSGASKAIAIGNYFTATQFDLIMNLPVTMRTTPTIVQVTGTDYYVINQGGGADYINSFTLDLASTTGFRLYNGSEAAGTSGRAGTCFTNNAAASLAFSAEL